MDVTTWSGSRIELRRETLCPWMLGWLRRFYRPLALLLGVLVAVVVSACAGLEAPDELQAPPAAAVEPLATSLAPAIAQALNVALEPVLAAIKDGLEAYEIARTDDDPGTLPWEELGRYGAVGAALAALLGYRKHLLKSPPPPPETS